MAKGRKLVYYVSGFTVPPSTPSRDWISICKHTLKIAHKCATRMRDTGMIDVKIRRIYLRQFWGQEDRFRSTPVRILGRYDGPTNRACKGAGNT